MFYTGFADEAGQAIEVQIRVTQELGWNYIELRSIDGVNITDLTDDKFAEVAEKLQVSGVRVNGFGSTVANWGKSPLEDAAFAKSVQELQRAIPRMKCLGTKIIRGMSFGIIKDQENNAALDEEVVQKLKYLVQICEDAGVIYAHENCMNHFSQSYRHMEKLLDKIDSPAFQILFDTGNPPFGYNRMGSKPYKKQSSWEAYSILKERICHVHIKDSIYLCETNGIFPEAEFTFPGEGHGEVRRILTDLLKNGYVGGLSIEPHMVSVFHHVGAESGGIEQLQYANYLEYGRRLMQMVDEIRGELARR